MARAKHVLSKVEGPQRAPSSKDRQKFLSGFYRFSNGCPGGETPEQVGVRVDRLIARVRAVGGHVALFAHGHIFRVFAARWLGLPAPAGSHFLLDTATLSILSYYRGLPAVKRWNAELMR